MTHLFFPIIDNGMQLSRTSWGMSLAIACASVLRPYKLSFERLSFPYPTEAMNLATHSFRKSGADEMIVIDTDVEFEPHHLDSLLSHDLPLVFGLYPIKRPGLHWPAMPLEGDLAPFACDGRPNLREVARVARGFMRVHRSVFDRIEERGIVEKEVCNQTGEEMSIFWKCLPGGGSEDFAFCDLWRSIGGRVMVDNSIRTRHEGSASYPIEATFNREAFDKLNAA